MIELGREELLGIGAAVLSAVAGAAKWFVSRSVSSFNSRLEDHEQRITKIESEYVTKEDLRLAITEIKDIIDHWSTDIKRGVENAHGRLDDLYNQLLRRSQG